ncbi:MAG: hypothetical protein AAFV80_15580, partial [Bacteroidota bacterium]
MNLENLQRLWTTHEAELKATRTLNVHLLREMKLGKARSSIHQLLYFPICSLIFYLLIGSYAL